MRMGQLQTAKAVLRVGGQLSKVINHDERLLVGLQTVECNQNIISPMHAYGSASDR